MGKKPDMYRILTKTPGKEPEKVEVSNREYMDILPLEKYRHRSKIA